MHFAKRLDGYRLAWQIGSDMIFIIVGTFVSTLALVNKEILQLDASVLAWGGGASIVIEWSAVSHAGRGIEAIGHYCNLGWPVVGGIVDVPT